MRQMVSSLTGTSRSRSAYPSERKCATRPPRATRVWQPEILPGSTYLVTRWPVMRSRRGSSNPAVSMSMSPPPGPSRRRPPKGNVAALFDLVVEAVQNLGLRPGREAAVFTESLQLAGPGAGHHRPGGRGHTVFPGSRTLEHEAARPAAQLAHHSLKAEIGGRGVVAVEHHGITGPLALDVACIRVDDVGVGQLGSTFEIRVGSLVPARHFEAARCVHGCCRHESQNPCANTVQSCKNASCTAQ